MYNCKLWLRNYLGRNPQLFYFIYSLKKQSAETFTNPNTQIIIEGYPRSANTFAVEAFQYLQPEPVQIAHHHHVPAQIIKGVELNIPTIVLIRSPQEAIASYQIYEPRLSLTQAITLYIDFYTIIYPYKSQYVIAHFEEVRKNFSSVIKRVNKKYFTSFFEGTLSDLDHQFLINKINLITSDYHQSHAPSLKREILKAEIKKKLVLQKYRHLLDQAEEIYNKLVLDENKY